jgi:hypothetical protein
MKYILLALAMLINISVFSQDKYNLFILGNRTFTGFTGDNSLKGVDQIYYLEKDSSWIVGETSMVFCNEYLTFSVDSGHVTVHWFEENEGTYKCDVFRVKNQYYVIKFIVNDEPIYYYFFRRYAFLEKIWN